MITLIKRLLIKIITYVFSRGLFLITILALFIGILGGAYQLGGFLKTPLTLEEETIFDIPEGSSLVSISQNLVKKGGLKNELYFKLYSRFTGQATKIKAGEYLLRPGMTPQDLLTLLVSGRSIQHSFALIEGKTFREILKELEKNEYIISTLEGLTPEEVMAELGLEGKPYEGYFLPDTYLFPRKYEDKKLLLRSYEAMEKALERAWGMRDSNLPITTPHELLTLASIIEKETGIAKERPEIAGVFVRRLQKGMRLQTDPTIIYGLGDGYRGTIYRSDLQKDTPYNTYLHEGLPPGPIAMPSRAAIYAAANPASGTSLYFVAKGDGSWEHVFSDTLEEHNKAVQQYRKNIGQ